MTDYKGWDAIFVDGPMAEGFNNRHFTGDLPRELFFAPGLASWSPWSLVGTTGNEPDVPWDGQVKYVAVDEIPPATEGGTVRFRLESDGGDTGHSDEAKDVL